MGAKSFSIAKLSLGLVTTLAVILVLAQPTHAQGSWLDSPLVNWNRQAGSLPKLPQPSPDEGGSGKLGRCRQQQVRQPASAAERALVRRGWVMYGPTYSFDLTRVVTALSGFDGMCRPLGFQVFVYWEGRYAGTLSPVLMNSRTDGSLVDIHLNSPTNISASFVRYKESDPLCCPSGESSVVYDLRRDDVPTLTAAGVSHSATCVPGDSSASGSGTDAISLFGKRWTLIEIEEQKVSTKEPYVEFDRDQKRVSGSGGCNRFSGAFEVAGSSLKLSRIASTRRACLDAELQRIETSFLKLLETTTRYEVQGNTLRLFANDRPVLVFTK
jgi:heat shock protein HslJ